MNAKTRRNVTPGITRLLQQAKKAAPPKRATQPLIWGRSRRKRIASDRIWHHDDLTLKNLRGANGRRLGETFKVWEGDHPQCTTEVKARLLLAKGKVVGCVCEAKWGTDILQFICLVDLALHGKPTKGLPVLLIPMPPLRTPGFWAFILSFTGSLAVHPAVRKAYRHSLKLLKWSPKDPGGLRFLKNPGRMTP